MKKYLSIAALGLLTASVLVSCGPKLEIPEGPTMPSLDGLSTLSIEEATVLYNSAKEAYLNIDTFGGHNVGQNVRAIFNDHAFEGDDLNNNYLDGYGMIETNYDSHYIRVEEMVKGGNVSDGKSAFYTETENYYLLSENEGEVTYKNKLGDSSDSEKFSETFKYSEETDKFNGYYHYLFTKLNDFYVASNAIFNNNFTLEDASTDIYTEAKKYYSRGEGSFIVELTRTYDTTIVHKYIFEYEDNFIKYYSYDKTTRSSRTSHHIYYEYNNVVANSEFNY